MNNPVVLILFAIVVALLLVLKARRPREDNGPSYVGREALFTPAERSFLGVLEQALDSRYRVFGKVRLGDLVRPAKGLDAGNRTTAWNRINQKHVDFVVCTSDDLEPVGVLELDDQSHSREERAGRDRLVDHALATAGIPVVRFSVKRGYDLQDVRSRLTAMLPDDRYSDIVPKALEADDAKRPEPPAPVCPRCAAVMVKRQVIKGVQAGKWFWTCPEFPKCRQLVAIRDEE